MNSIPPDAGTLFVRFEMRAPDQGATGGAQRGTIVVTPHNPAPVADSGRGIHLTSFIQNHGVFHMRRRERFNAVLLAITLLSWCMLAPSPAAAKDPPQAPVAVRWWGQAMVTIETWWGLTIAIDPYDPAQTGYTDPHVRADVVLISHEHFDHNNADLIAGDPVVVRGLTEDGEARTTDMTLYRAVNDLTPRIAQTSGYTSSAPHPVRIRSIPAWHDDEHGAKRGANAMFLVETDGVRILHCGDLGQTELTTEQLDAIGRVDALLIPVGGTYTIDAVGAARIIEQLAPRLVVPIHFKTPALKFNLELSERFFTSLGDRANRRQAVGNTLAVAALADGENAGRLIAIELGYEPWIAPAHMRQNLDRAHEARETMAKTIESVTPEQLDHKPSNGTHTLRWNAEHTAGSEMAFITLALHDADATLPQIRISPAQQPENYTPANPDWSSAEEAAHIRRVGAFTERFAYVLADVDPAENRYPTFFKSLDGLFKLLASHYQSHHSNVLEKFELPDWPKQE